MSPALLRPLGCLGNPFRLGAQHLINILSAVVFTLTAALVVWRLRTWFGWITAMASVRRFQRPEQPSARP
ncbi:hypothetical protein [Candidatus Amarolinea aalborgensis]|uniref:hypothetical protein n=1 Tax=Candidatus Amarolinea aalborgensis TaxID=2249329 RepID=UPI003BF999BF